MRVHQERPTTSRNSRHGKRAENNEMDKAMMSFIEKMSTLRDRQSDRNYPFCDPNNATACFLRTMYHVLERASVERQLENQLCLFNYAGVLELQCQEFSYLILANMIPLRGHTINFSMRHHPYQINLMHTFFPFTQLCSPYTEASLLR